MSSLVDNIDKVHEQLIKEEGINIADLPEDIRKRMKGWNLLLARLSKNPQDENLFRTLQKQSIEMADKIQDFIEKDFDEDDEDYNDGDDNKKVNDKKVDNPDSNKKPEVNKDADDKKVSNQNTKSNEPKRFGNLVMEKKILSAMNGGDRISINQLEEIIGKQPEFPEQEVNNIRLRKVFMASYYRLV